MMAKTIIEVKAKANSGNSNSLRDFSRRTREAGIVNKSRSLRFYDRKQSEAMRKKDALKKIERQKEVKKLIKLGKLRDTRRKLIEIKPAKKDEEK
jgi:ribosomal protein S21